jgi:hypothetical protein
MIQSHDKPIGPTPPLDYAGPMGMRPPAGKWMRGCGPAALFVGLMVLAVMCILPQMGKPRRQMERAACAANLRAVGQALATYANAHGSRYPDTLDQLYLKGDVRDVRVFVCPTCGDTPARGTSPQAVAADLRVGGHVSFVYAGAGLMPETGRGTIVMYEHLSNHKGEGGNVLFANGEVAWFYSFEMSQSDALLAARRRAENPPPATQPENVPRP